MQTVMRFVAGVALLAAAGFMTRMWIVIRRYGKANSSNSNLRVYAPGQSRPEFATIDVAGIVSSPDALAAPVSGRPCVFWELSLNEMSDDQGGDDRRPTSPCQSSGSTMNHQSPVMWTCRRMPRPVCSRTSCGASAGVPET